MTAHTHINILHTYSSYICQQSHDLSNLYVLQYLALIILPEQVYQLPVTLTCSLINQFTITENKFNIQGSRYSDKHGYSCGVSPFKSGIGEVFYDRMAARDFNSPK